MVLPCSSSGVETTNGLLIVISEDCDSWGQLHTCEGLATAISSGDGRIVCLLRPRGFYKQFYG